MRVFYLNQQEWQVILKAVYDKVGSHGRPTGVYGTTWRKLAEANDQKRFTLEVENPNRG
jgi:hypothetical protein